MDFTNLAPGRKIVVIHEDDVGMSHGANKAFVELSALGSCSSGSVMPPCPWFPEAVELATANHALDLGVHLTLTSEKKPYRWRPAHVAAALGWPYRSDGLFLAGRAQCAPRRSQSGRGGTARPDRRHALGRRRRHPSRRAYGDGDVPGVRRHLRRARARIRSAAAPGEGLQHLQSAQLFRSDDQRQIRCRAGARQGRGLRRLRSRAGDMWDRKEDAETAYRAMFSRLPSVSPSCRCISTRRATSRRSSPRTPISAPTNMRCSRAARSRMGRATNGLEIVGMRAFRDDLRARRRRLG